MLINRVDDKAFIENTYHNAFVNLSFKSDLVYIELLKVLPEFRSKSYAKKLLREVIEYIKCLGFHTIRLNPLPLDTNGLNFEQLTKFYRKFGFEMLNSNDRSQPYLMEKII